MIEEEKDEISCIKYGQFLLNDKVHSAIMSVLDDAKLPFELADFQKVSLHVIGSQRDLILISPTGSGKMLGTEIIIINL